MRWVGHVASMRETETGYNLRNGRPEKNTQHYWVFGLCPSSGILETRKYNDSETWSVFFLKWGVAKTPTQLGPLESIEKNKL
jgi:hypothetical protein